MLAFKCIQWHLRNSWNCNGLIHEMFEEKLVNKKYFRICMFCVNLIDKVFLRFRPTGRLCSVDFFSSILIFYSNFSSPGYGVGWSWACVVGLFFPYLLWSVACTGLEMLGLLYWVQGCMDRQCQPCLVVFERRAWWWNIRGTVHTSDLSHVNTAH